MRGVPGDKKSVEAPMALMDEVEGDEIGIGEVFFVGEVELLAPGSAW